MSETQSQPAGNWKTQVYGIGVIGGALFGLLAAYIYARAADESAQRNAGRPEAIPTVQLIALLLSALGLMRQIAEAGKPKK
ncbi:MAG: hypothetical protein ACUVSX_01815 [Aggregatilineales bacterium]